MTVDPRDELWQVAFETYYDAYYQELLCEKLIGRWQRADEITRVLVAVTASSSAISGWVLWTNPHFRPFWTAVAGLAAFLTIIHAALGVPARLHDQGDAKRRWAGLRTDLETFRYRMKVNPDFPIETFVRDFAGYRKRYGDAIQHSKDDVLGTHKAQQRVQDRLNVILIDEIE